MRALPNVSKRIDQILKECQTIGRVIQEENSVPIHRDFYHDQIMFSSEFTYLVDLDLASFGQPELDLGNFLAHLTEYGIRKFDDADYWQKEETEIAQHYLSTMPLCTSKRIEAFKTISLARHIYISWSRRERRSTTAMLIDAVEERTNRLTTTL